jgi:hypothetical protein
MLTEAVTITSLVRGCQIHFPGDSTHSGDHKAIRGLRLLITWAHDFSMTKKLAFSKVREEREREREQIKESHNNYNC